ncbi:MAG: glycosyltransferase family 39 protein, partial [Candidatus Eremiobacteraeota bacterium]|nr:glycosyltransferase family 39 protein [Candidatus Eremiobacteraeota bacterium]
MDVQSSPVEQPWRNWIFPAGVGLILLLAIALRLKGIHDPILDHPGWRQGDTAAIARNFARLQFDVMHPQTLYNGAPPNYVELELQIVPFLAATLYKLFGVHEIFGRLIALAFSVATAGIVALFARWLSNSPIAGITAGFFFAIFPGSIYYGRTFMPDAAMVFFLTAALYSVTRLLLEDDAMGPRALARSTALLAFAYLAKPVAVLGIVPVIGAIWERARLGKHTRISALAVLLLVPLVVLWSYDHRVASYAEWHWASGITKLHVLPALRDSLTSVSRLGLKLGQFRLVLGMLRETMLGTVPFLLAIASFVALPWIPVRGRLVLWGWLAGGLAYVYVVVTVERVDYYMAPLLPLCAIAIGCAAAFFAGRVATVDAAPAARYAILAILPIVAVFSLIEARAAIAPYYRYNKDAYRNAVFLNKTLDPGALVVIGHYGPDVQYYIDRFGWEEDPALWTPLDEESAIRKGARYFISIEDNRLRANTELCAWLA